MLKLRRFVGTARNKPVLEKTILACVIVYPVYFSHGACFETNQNDAMQQGGVSCAPAVVVCFSVSSGGVIWWRIELTSDAKFLSSFEELFFFFLG